MTELIRQRTGHDCAICTIAMALCRSYDEVHAAGLESKGFDPEVGTRSEQAILKVLGLSTAYENGRPVGDFVDSRKGYETSTESFRDRAWGRRAILTVPSLNIPGGWHSVYWDGSMLFDPCLLKTYETFDQLHPTEMILFRECGVSRAEAA